MDTSTLIAEKPYRPMSGWGPLLVLLALVACGVFFFTQRSPWGIAWILGAFLMLFGFMAIAPNQARVLLLFGNYRGTARESGFYWVNPFFTKKKISLRVRNFETGSTTTPEQRDYSPACLPGGCSRS